MKKKILISSLLLAMGTSSYADTTADEIALLKQQIKMLSEKIDQLEAKTVQQEKDSKAMVEKQEKTIKKASWASRISLSGDFRYRYEYIDQRGNDVRNRNRIRLRVGAKAQVNEDLVVGFQFATGADDPVSTNQTLDGAFSTKDVRLDLAYFDYKFSESISVIGGKMKNPFYRPAKTPILWDGDLNPEGVALKFKNNGFTGTLVGYSLDERKADDDVLLFGGQINKTFDFDASSLIAGVGYYDYQELQGSAPLFDGKGRGNTLDANGNIANDFNIFEGLVEYKTKIAQRPFSVFGSYYQNMEADDLDSAFAFGVSYGKIKNLGSWSIGYSYMDTEADAVYALFSDSDFAGGQTDARGHLLKAGYGLGKNMSLGLTYIDSEQNQSASEQTDYDRLQMDFKIKFK